MTIEYSKFGKTKLVEADVYVDGVKVQKSDDLFHSNELRYDKTLWVEQASDYYAFENPEYKNCTVAVVTRDAWIRGKEVLVGNESSESNGNFLRD